MERQVNEADVRQVRRNDQERVRVCEGQKHRDILHYVNERPRKDRTTCVCVCVCVH